MTLKIGNVFIADTTDSDGAIEIKTNDDLEVLVNLQGYSTSYFTNNLEVGRSSSNVLSVMPNDKKINVNNGAALNLINGKYTSLSNTINGNYYEINNTKNNDSSFTYKTLMHKNNSIFYSVRGAKGDQGDFIFNRTDGDTNVKINGDLLVKNEITGVKSTIVCRFTDSKVSFFATA